MTELRASVIVPTYQRRDSVLRLLGSLSRQSVPQGAFEVVIAIDGSTDGTREAAEAYTGIEHLAVVFQPNAGRASVRNAGIARATGTLLAFLDDDMEASPDWLAAHLAAHDKARALNEQWAVVGAAPIDAASAHDIGARYVGEKFNAHMLRLAQPGFEFQMRDFYSGNFSILRSVLNSIGGFDAAFTRYGNEDLDLSVRMRRAGVRIVFSGEASARQYYDKNLRSLALDNRAKGWTAMQLWRKHPETFTHLRLSQYGAGTLSARAVRGALLGLSKVWKGAPDAFVRLVSTAARSGIPGVQRSVPVLLDTYYWLGVRDARRAEEQK